MNVLVLLGGESPERAVSLRSGRAIADALRASGVSVIEYDPTNGIKVLKELVQKVNIVFPILHGKNGEDGAIQEVLEILSAKFLGTGSVSSKICFDKEQTHKVLESDGVLMPKYAVVTAEDLNQPIFSKPFVLKPINGGSSLDTLVARKLNLAVRSKTKSLLDKYESMLVEELIMGQEITVAILGEKALPVIAIIPPENCEFDYNNKYNGASKELCPAPEDIVTFKLQKEAQAIALKVHNLLKARHISRTDMIIDSNGNIYVLELNTMPGMTNQSLFPVAANAAGLSMEKLVLKLIEQVNGKQLSDEDV
jgi:D-alanine-D-alanine ligase